MQRFICDVPRRVQTRQAKVYENVPGRTLGPSIGSRFAFEDSISITLDWVESVRVHPRRFKHDVVRCAVPQKAVRLKLPHESRRFVPMGHMMLMHELDALCDQL
jgi:hypothetical protein